MSLNDKKTLLIRKSTKKKKKTQVVDMETFAKTILIFAFYDFLTEKESFLNKNSINY
jgi:hypothetical protein